MVHDQFTKREETAKAIENWYPATDKNREKSPEEVQLLILYQLHKLEERIKIVEYQTRTHWVN